MRNKDRISKYVPLQLLLILMVSVQILAMPVAYSQDAGALDDKVAVGDDEDVLLFQAVNLSAAVESYRPVVEQECLGQGIPEYSEVILAIMMQESGGNAADVMQASESAGLPPNSLHPDASIKQGVGYFAKLLQLSGYKKVGFNATLQAYNYGEGYVDYVSQTGGTYSVENAYEFSEMKKLELGVGRYGDKEYVPHVHRYLKVGRDEMTADQAGDLVAQYALSRVGDPYNQDLRGQGDYIDCSGLTQWCYEQIGVSLPDTAAEQAKYCVDNNLIVSGDNLMRGDLIFYSFKANGRYMNISHVGIYIGDGMMVDSSSTMGQVVHRKMYDDPLLYARPRAINITFPGALPE